MCRKDNAFKVIKRCFLVQRKRKKQHTSTNKYHMLSSVSSSLIGKLFHKQIHKQIQQHCISPLSFYRTYFVIGIFSCTCERKDLFSTVDSSVNDLYQLTIVKNLKHQNGSQFTKSSKQSFVQSQIRVSPLWCMCNVYFSHVCVIIRG